MADQLHERNVASAGLADAEVGRAQLLEHRLHAGLGHPLADGAFQGVALLEREVVIVHGHLPGRRSVVNSGSAAMSIVRIVTPSSSGVVSLGGAVLAVAGGLKADIRPEAGALLLFHVLRPQRRADILRVSPMPENVTRRT